MSKPRLLFYAVFTSPLTLSYSRCISLDKGSLNLSQILNKPLYLRVDKILQPRDIKRKPNPDGDRREESQDGHILAYNPLGKRFSKSNRKSCTTVDNNLGYSCTSTILTTGVFGSSPAYIQEPHPTRLSIQNESPLCKTPLSFSMQSPNLTPI